MHLLGTNAKGIANNDQTAPLFWSYNVCKDLSVPIIRNFTVITVLSEYLGDIPNFIVVHVLLVLENCQVFKFVFLPVMSCILACSG